MLLLRYKRLWAVLLAPASILLTSLAAAHPAETERIYSTGIYPVLSGIIGRIFSLFPFSVAEHLVILLPLALLVYICLQLVKIVRIPAERGKRVARLAANLACLTGVVWFLFTAFCGLNYQRESFTVHSGLQVRDSSAQELVSLCTELVANANMLSHQVERDASGVMVSSFGSYYDAAAVAAEAYVAVGADYPVLSGFTPRPKPVQFSQVLSRLDLVGIYVPYTFEANINTDVVGYVVPSSMMHELAHYKGYMREDEANFIAYLSCRDSGSEDFAYSGTLLALIHATNALYSADKELYFSVIQSLDERVRTDFRANDEYWHQFEGPIAEASAAINDVYLKSNKQAAGVKSYGRMVDLLLAEYRQRYGLQ